MNMNISMFHVNVTSSIWSCKSTPLKSCLKYFMYVQLWDNVIFQKTQWFLNGIFSWRSRKILLTYKKYFYLKNLKSPNMEIYGFHGTAVMCSIHKHTHTHTPDIKIFPQAGFKPTQTVRSWKLLKKAVKSPFFALYQCYAENSLNK